MEAEGDRNAGRVDQGVDMDAKPKGPGSTVKDTVVPIYGTLVVKEKDIDAVRVMSLNMNGIGRWNENNIKLSHLKNVLRSYAVDVCGNDGHITYFMSAYAPCKAPGIRTYYQHLQRFIQENQLATNPIDLFRDKVSSRIKRWQCHWVVLMMDSNENVTDGVLSRRLAGDGIRMREAVHKLTEEGRGSWSTYALQRERKVERRLAGSGFQTTSK
eukprot:scaffold25134_cov139-Skeletonema_dohrnii-CCMP3373.AAC.1